LSCRMTAAVRGEIGGAEVGDRRAAGVLALDSFDVLME
jgi:hypothetical protein